MPSPFPGMDPYLEGELWTNFHTQFAVEIARLLTPLLRPRYVALTQKRFIAETFDETATTISSIYPDIGVAETTRGDLSASAVAVATPLETVSLLPEEVPHVWVEIQDVQARKLVTSIEFLSPTNKRGEGREEYLKKRAAVLRSEANLLELDLIRHGQRVPLRDPLPAFPYFVFLSRARRRPITEYWPIGLNQSLPAVPVPLLEPDPDVSLPLQQALTNVYDGFGYDLLIDYHLDPAPQLSADASVWADQVLRGAGRR
ncbi:MAG: DUF4058 family protein [Gemmataceae bacterium]